MATAEGEKGFDLADSLVVEGSEGNMDLGRIGGMGERGNRGDEEGEEGEME